MKCFDKNLGGGEDLTLLIPMYNKAPYIERMVKSLSEQTYLPKTKIVVVDDCSTDGSFEILKSAAEKYQVPMTVHFNEMNLGFFKNLPHCYRFIDTDFWAVLDPDDYYILPDRLECAVKFLKEHPDHSAHFCRVRFEKNGETVSIDGPAQACSSENYNSPYANVQTSGAVFRNFWSDKILDAIDARVESGELCYAEDWFRCLLAVHFGKVYHDSFIGVAYPTQTGFINKIDKLDSLIGGVQYYYEMFRFCIDVLNDRANGYTCLTRAWRCYCEATDDFCDKIKRLQILQWNNTGVYVKKTNKNYDAFDIVNCLFEYCSKLDSIGVVVN